MLDERLPDLCMMSVNRENNQTDRFEQDLRRLQPGVDPARKFSGGGAITVIFGSQVLLRVHYSKTDRVYFTTRL